MGLWDAYKGVESAPFKWLMGDDPSKEANKYLKKIPGQIEPYFKPYMEAGAGALPVLQGQYGQLLNDPGAMINKIGAGYHESPGFQFALQKALAGGNRAFAAGGMGGSPAAANWGMETATGLANQDYNQWLEKALSQYGMGLKGEQELATGGQTAATNMADQIAQMLAAQAQLKYQGTQAQNQARGGLLTTGLGLGLAPFTGGASLGLLGMNVPAGGF